MRELEEKYIHLFETDAEGKILRGIEVCEGWKEITEQLLESLEWIRTHNLHLNSGMPHDIKIFQLKQKFGTYTAYIKYGDHVEHMIERAIGRAEGKAQLTCESCGAIGKFEPTKGWISILCEQCKKSQNK
jgi:methyl coenzyme M reductase subunit D